VTTDLTGPFVLAVPLLIAIFCTFAWILWSRPASPPRFRGYAVRQGWQVDPMAWLDQDLRKGRLTGGIIVVRDRLLLELARGHHVSLRQARRSPLLHRAKRDSVVDRACRQVRALEATYSLAYRVEDPFRMDLWSRWRRPVWRERARRRFEKELSEAQSLWPLLERSS
jgi:hypothetical protein